MKFYVSNGYDLPNFKKSHATEKINVVYVDSRFLINFALFIFGISAYFWMNDMGSQLDYGKIQNSPWASILVETAPTLSLLLGFLSFKNLFLTRVIMFTRRGVQIVYNFLGMEIHSKRFPRLDIKVFEMNTKHKKNKDKSDFYMRTKNAKIFLFSATPTRVDFEQAKNYSLALELLQFLENNDYRINYEARDLVIGAKKFD